ncbi:MAG TPA: T9SS type A sorting domain-containing protein, partial [Saprospiraceae bacterium]|nr:T9SS type A sorting domain-containing protein [Saprospiraceae bacterium]
TSVTIDFPADFIPTASGIQLPLCFGQSNGAAAVTVQGGSGSFSYQWNDPAAQTGAQAVNLAAGNYSVSVTDNASGCVEILNLTVAQPPVLQLTASNTQNALCAGQSNGSATVSATGGTGVYTYLWNDPAAQTGPTASNLPAGTYTATITDANGCTAQTQVELNEPQVLEAQIAGFSAPLCFGQSNGSATVAVTGGTGSYSYQWNDPALQNSATAANLAPGNYTVTVRDANNCPATTSVTIPNTPQTVITPVDQTPPLCAGSGNGSLSATAAGGTGALNFQWSNGQSGASLSGLTAGNYTLSVTDGNGCVQTRSFSLLDPDALVLTTANTTPATCYTGADGSISIGLQGGTGAYVYLWSDSAGQTTATASGLARGDYSVTATDANGCTLVEQFSITSLGLQIFITPIVANTSCEGAANANISLGVSGGAGGFSYAWSGGQSGSLLSNVGAGTYVVTATDAAGCTETAAITVENGAPFRIDIGPADTLLCEGERFFVDFSNTDYTVQWTSLSGFSSQAKLTALSQADTYFLRVTNAQGCAAFDTIRVAVVAEPLQAFFVIPTDVVLGQEVVALEGSWPLPGQVNWYFPTDSVELLRREGDQYFFRFTQVGQVRLRMQSLLGACEDWIQKVITVHADSTTIPGLNPDEPDILGIVVAPNPNDGQFSVQVALSGPKDIVLSLYNINGVVQERRIRQGQSSYTENFVVSGQPGTYFLIVQSPKQRRTYAIQVVGP